MTTPEIPVVPLVESGSVTWHQRIRNGWTPAIVRVEGRLYPSSEIPVAPATPIACDDESPAPRIPGSLRYGDYRPVPDGEPVAEALTGQGMVYGKAALEILFSDEPTGDG